MKITIFWGSVALLLTHQRRGFVSQELESAAIGSCLTKFETRLAI
jgi:hypothetical protein